MKRDPGHQEARQRADERDLETVLGAVGVKNPIPWTAILAIVAPVIARIAIRFILRRQGRTASEENIRAAADHVRAIIARSLPSASK